MNQYLKQAYLWSSANMGLALTGLGFTLLLYNFNYLTIGNFPLIYFDKSQRSSDDIGKKYHVSFSIIQSHAESPYLGGCLWWQDCDCEIIGPDTTIALTCLVFLIYHIAMDKGYNAICFPSYITWLYKCCYVIAYISWASLRFYARPVLAFGFCHLCVCARQCYNLSPILAIIAKSGPEMQSTLVKIPIVLRIDWHWSLRPKLT